MQAVLDRGAKTMLTEFFVANKKIRAAIANGNPNNDRLCTYLDLPVFYCWDAKKKEWRRRKRNDAVLGRIYTVPAGTDLFYLRMLLNHVVAPESYDDLLTFEGVHYDTFQQAAFARGLLEDDAEWDRCLNEAALCQMPRQMRWLFATLLVFGHPLDPLGLLRRHLDNMSEDRRHLDPLVRSSTAIADIGRNLETLGKNLMGFFNTAALQEFGYPEFMGGAGGDAHGEQHDDDAGDEPFDPQEVDNMNQDQRAALDRIIASVRNPADSEKTFFVDGPGGTGKTTLFTTLLKLARSQQVRCLAVASSGIAACLLPAGRTAHSALAIPLEIHDKSTCMVNAESDLANRLRRTSLMVYDEVAMAHRYAPEAVDRTLRDIRSVDLPNGSMIVVYGGDFRQILPVIPGGSRRQVVQACLKKSYLWRHVKVLPLTINMRLQTRPDFQQYLLDVGEGKSGPEVVPQPWMQTEGNSKESLITEIFNDPNDFSDRVILTVRNDDAQDINRKITEMLPGEKISVYSADKVANDDDAALYPIEFLNSLLPSGVAPHHLDLKVGQYVILLRNLNPARGLCNGTRMQVKQVHRSVLAATIVGGRFDGQDVLIPRITMRSSDPRLPFTLCRRQFPITGAFAMTTNKAQGQSFGRVGVWLGHEVFSHGQLYVALSRCRHPENIRVADGTGKPIAKMKNVVFREVFD
ncbi:ATP-dependent DNA helicase [Plasmodiophora brassicae]